MASDTTYTRRLFDPTAIIQLLCVLFAASCSITGCERRSDPGGGVVRIDAAASIAYVIESLAGEAEQALGVRIEVNAGASGALAQQVAKGDRADVFISANPRWMDWLAEQELIDPSTRLDVAANRLIVVGVPGVAPLDRLEGLAGSAYQPLAVGDPAFVPAGRYAVQAMAAHGLAPGRQVRLAEAPNVRAALAFVVSGECPAGVVYETDLRGVTGVIRLFEVDPADHEPVRYPAAVLRDAPNREGARRVLAWLRGERARGAFGEAGFEVVQ